MTTCVVLPCILFLSSLAAAHPLYRVHYYSPDWLRHPIMVKANFDGGPDEQPSVEMTDREIGGGLNRQQVFPFPAGNPFIQVSEITGSVKD